MEQEYNFYKAELRYMSELFVDNDKDKGCDPDTFQDHGLVDTMRAENLEQLKKDLEQRFDNIEHFVDNRYEAGYEETNRDGTHESIMVSIYIYKCRETSLENPVNFSE